jgi:hypothetical protein
MSVTPSRAHSYTPAIKTTARIFLKHQVFITRYFFMLLGASRVFPSLPSQVIGAQGCAASEAPWWQPADAVEFARRKALRYAALLGGAKPGAEDDRSGKRKAVERIAHEAKRLEELASRVGEDFFAFLLATCSRKRRVF